MIVYKSKNRSGSMGRNDRELGAQLTEKIPNQLYRSYRYTSILQFDRIVIMLRLIEQTLSNSYY
jgi:hypothetical protein